MFKRKSRRAPWLRVSAGQMQNESMGRLPENLAEGDNAPQPAPEYIAEAAPASEELWAHEQARYRAKAEPEQRD